MTKISTKLDEFMYIDLLTIENTLKQFGLQYSYNIEYEQYIHDFKNPKPYCLQMTLWDNKFNLHFTIKAKDYINLLIKAYNLISTIQYDKFIELISTEK